MATAACRPLKFGVKLFVIGFKSNVRQWKGWFRQPCRLALLWGLGVAKGGAGGFGKCIRGPFKFGVKLSSYRF